MKILKSQLKEIIREVIEEQLQEKNWIKGAIKKPGALRKSMGVKKGEKIPAAEINKKIATYIKRAKVIRN